VVIWCGALEEVFAAEEGGGGFEGCGPVVAGGFVVGAEGFDVEGDGEALLWAGEIEEGGADDAVEHGVGMVEGRCSADEAVQKLLLMVYRDEAGAVAQEEVDVAGESVGELSCEGLVSEIEVEVEAELVEFFGLEGPGVTFGGEDWRARGVEGAESVHERREVFGLGEMIEVVGVFAQVDEVAARMGRIGRRIRPGDDEDWVVGSALCGPFG
jgi:hypothetical protein